MNRFLVIIIPVMFLILSVSAKEIDTVTLQLKWKHQYQFAGFYMAKEKGYFKAAGLEVIIKEGIPGLDIVKEVVEGRAQFGIGMPNLLIRRSEGEPIVMLYPVFHHSPLIILSKLSSNIKTPKDLVGKTLMMNTKKDAQIEAMFNDVGVDFTMINITPHSWDINDLISDKVDAMTAYITNQPYLLKEHNIEISIMDPKTYGIDFFGDCLFSSDSYISKEKEKVNAFISASQEGWDYALRHIDETVDTILSRYDHTLNRDILKKEALISKDLIQIHSHNIRDDSRHENRWQYIKSVFVAKGLMKNNVNLHDFLYEGVLGSPNLKLRKNLYITFITVLLISSFLIIVLFFNWKLRKEIESVVAAEQNKNSDILRQKELDELLYRTLVSINEMIQLSMKDIMDYALEKAVLLTDSKIGYIYYYSEKEEMLTLYSWSKSVMPECKVMNPQTEYELSKTGLWGEAIRQRKPVITNNYNAPNKFKKGTPKGHVALKSHMNVPIFYKGEIVALIGVGNKEKDYTDTDVRHLSILMDGIWLIKVQRETQQKLEESEMLYRSLFDNSAEGIVLVDIEKKKIEFVNQSFTDLLGYSVDELRDIDILSLNPIDEKEKMKEYLEEAVKSDKSKYFQDIQLLHKNGIKYFFDMRTKRINVSGKPYLMGLFANITERKMAEEEIIKINEGLELRIENRTKELEATLARLSESEEMHRVMYETMTQGIVYQNTDGYVTRVNDAAVRILGVDLDQFQGRTSMDPRWKTIHEDGSDFPGNEHPAMVALQTGEVVKDVIIGVFNPIMNDHVWVNVTAVPLFRDNEEKPYQVYATLENITEKRKADLELKEAKENAEKANRAKSEFLANMSHEIRTPLNAVTGFSELLSNLLIDEKQKSYVTSIKSAGKSLLTLINDILDLSKIEAGMMEIKEEPVNLKVLLTELYSIFDTKAKEENLDFKIKVPEEFPEYLLLDETRLRQVLLNLVGNAFKFTHAGFVSVACKVDNYYDDGTVDIVIIVTDSGIGIKNEEINEIFDSFKQQEGQSTRKYGGTGLGLSISKKLIEMMNGSINVKSKAEEGAQFTVLLNEVPVVREPEIVSDMSNLPSYKNVIFDNPKILVVDDIPSNRDLICELLAKHNCNLIEAENGEEAIQIAKQDKPDVIIMDIRMPVMDGKTATKIIKDNKDLKDIPIIALTASVTKNEIIDIKALGFYGYLTKPINIDELFVELRKVLNNKIVDITDSQIPEDIQYPKISFDKLDILIDKTENELLFEFKKMLKVMKMSQLKEFSKKLKKVSNEFNYSPLKILSENLNHYIDIFDVIAIKNIENRLNEILDKLEDQKRDTNV